MPRTVKLGTRGAGVYKGIAGFMDIKKAFDEATRKMKWEKEKLTFSEGRKDIRAAKGERGATSRSLIRSGYSPVDVPGLLATGEAGGFREPPPEGPKISAGERQKIQAILQGLSERVDPTTGKGLKGVADAERFIRLQGIDPDSDPRIRAIIDQYPEEDTKASKRRFRDILKTAVKGIAASFIPGAGGGAAIEPGKASFTIPRTTTRRKGRSTATTATNITTLSDEKLSDLYNTTEDPEELAAAETELRERGFSFKE